MYSDDGRPEFEVNAGDNLLNWLEDGNVGTFALMCLIIGLLAGLFIAYIIKIMREESYSKYCDKCDKDISDKWKYCPYCGDSTDEVVHDAKDATDECKTNIESKVNDSNTPLWIAIIVLVAIIILFISGIIIFNTIPNNNTNVDNDGIIDSIKDTVTSERKAQNKDIELDFILIPSYTSADQYRVKLQANEKIKDLIIEIDFLDKDGNVLKTEQINIGSATPGNEYTYTLTQNSMHPDNIDKTKKFKYRVISGYVVEE